MHRTTFKKGLIPSVLTATILVVMLITPLVPRVVATPATTITLIDPQNGPVGTEVRVNGTIDIANGTYVLRWNEQLNVTTGNATEHDVHASFTVPQTMGAPSPGREVLIELIDNKTGSVANAIFRLYTEHYIKAVVPLPPFQLQEGQETDIWVNVTGGAENTVYVANITVRDPSNTIHWITVSLTDTSTTGYGDAKKRYPTDFGSGVHTNYTGTYHIAFNETLATADFTVGLTDRREYARRYFSEGKEETGEVVIQGSGYDNETVTVDIAYYRETALIPVEGYPREENASEGVITHRWEIPDNATLATYSMTLSSTTIEKPVKDSQNFTVMEIVVSCQAKNRYDNVSLAGVSVKAYHGALGSFLADNRTTNETGWVDFLLDHDHYSFGAYWEEMDVGNISFRDITVEAMDYVLRMEFHIKCDLARITMIVTDKDGPLPFISVTLADVITAPAEIPPLQTDYTGILSTNAFTGTIYRIEARRYGHLFFNQSIGNLTRTVGNLTHPFVIRCPTYTLFVHALDSKEHPIQNARVEVIEWSSGRVAGEGKTNEWGSIRFNFTFGRYKVRVYDPEQTVILNETVVDVNLDRFYLALHSKIANLDLSVRVLDYLGQPIPSAVVKIEREGMHMLDLATGPEGTASRQGILGGNYRVSLYVAGRLSAVKSLKLDESEEIIFRAGDYMTLGGYPLELNQLIAGISLTIMVVAFAVFTLIYRRRSKES